MLQGCPCTHERICDGSWPGGLLQADGQGPIDRQACDFVNRPGNWANPYPGWWYMLHGGESVTRWYAVALMLRAAQRLPQCSWCMHVVLRHRLCSAEGIRCGNVLLVICISCIDKLAHHLQDKVACYAACNVCLMRWFVQVASDSLLTWLFVQVASDSLLTQCQSASPQPAQQPCRLCHPCCLPQATEPHDPNLIAMCSMPRQPKCLQPPASLALLAPSSAEGVSEQYIASLALWFKRQRVPGQRQSPVSLAASQVLAPSSAAASSS